MLGRSGKTFGEPTVRGRTAVAFQASKLLTRATRPRSPTARSADPRVEPSGSILAPCQESLGPFGGRPPLWWLSPETTQQRATGGPPSARRINGRTRWTCPILFVWRLAGRSVRSSSVVGFVVIVDVVETVGIVDVYDPAEVVDGLSQSVFSFLHSRQRRD